MSGDTPWGDMGGWRGSPFGGGGLMERWERLRLRSAEGDAGVWRWGIYIYMYMCVYIYIYIIYIYIFSRLRRLRRLIA
jgi:hypothetical protein